MTHEETPFYIHKIRDQHIFAINVRRIAQTTALPAFGDNYYGSLFQRQANWISVLLGSCGNDAVFDLRLISRPEPQDISQGSIQIALLCKVSGSATKARSFANQVLRLTQTLFDDEYELVGVATKSDLNSIRTPFRIFETTSIARRSEIVPIDMPFGTRERPVGFRAGSQPFGKSKNQILHVYPYVPTYATANNLFKLMLWQDQSLSVSVRISKTSLTKGEAGLLLSEIGRCEYYSKTIAHHDEDIGNLSKQELSTAFQKALTQSLGALKRNAIVMQIEIAGETTIPGSIIESFGAYLTHSHATANDQGDPTIHLSGGFAHRKGSGANIKQMSRNWRDLAFSSEKDEDVPKEAGRLRSLFTSTEVASAFRLPMPTTEELPGVACKSYRTQLFVGSTKKGQLIGHSSHNNQSKSVRFSRSDRRRHVYAVGQTGTGKSTMFESMILDDLRNGEGLCVIDPHGDLIEKLLRKVPPARAKDVIVFDPGDLERPLGFNILEYNDESEKNFLIQELLAIIESLLPDRAMGGPMFFQQAKMVLRLVMSNSNLMGTLAQFYQVFSKDDFYKRFLPLPTPDSILQTFIDHSLSKARYTSVSSDGFSMGSYISSKFEPFIGDPMLRNIFGQRKSTFDLRKIMDQGKVLFVNLSKGRMGELNARFFGMVLIAKLQAAVMSRANIPENERRDFYLYVDEFQNLATQNFGVLLAEARKYRLNLILTNQFVTQVPGEIREAITGNVGTTIAFRVGSLDAEYLERDFIPAFNRFDLMNLPNFNTYVSTLVDGQVSKPFSMRILSDFSAESEEFSREIISRSRLTYGRLREAVEKEIEESLRPEATESQLASIRLGAADRETVLNLSIEHLELSVRTYNCLKQGGISSFTGIVRRTKSEFIETCHPSPKILKEIEDLISEFGFGFRDTDAFDVLVADESEFEILDSEEL